VVEQAFQEMEQVFRKMERANLAPYLRPLLYFFISGQPLHRIRTWGMEKGKGWGEKPRMESIKLEITPKNEKEENLVFWYSCYLDRLEKHQVLL